MYYGKAKNRHVFWNPLLNKLRDNGKFSKICRRDLGKYEDIFTLITAHKKWSFPLSISLVDVNKSTVYSGS